MESPCFPLAPRRCVRSSKGEAASGRRRGGQCFLPFIVISSTAGLVYGEILGTPTNCPQPSPTFFPDSGPRPRGGVVFKFRSLGRPVTAK